MKSLINSLRLPVVVLCMALISGCGIGGLFGDKTLAVTLDEYTVKLDSTSVSPAKVTFRVTNSGKEKHEFVILRTDIQGSKLPTEGDKVKEEAEGIEHVDEIDGLAPGEHKDLTVDLKAGTYLLICNYPGHVHGGMVTTLMVK
jgi:uncharacterized cupredoxin-like copper-binding protein